VLEQNGIDAEIIIEYTIWQLINQYQVNILKNLKNNKQPKSITNHKSIKK